MSYEGDNSQHERSIEQILEDMLVQLKLLYLVLEEAVETGIKKEDLDNE
jgi:hypothetical protein